MRNMNNKEKRLWEKMKEKELKKIWNLEEDSVWESYLTKKELKKLRKKHKKL